jgi:hypothetical protein
MEPLANACRCTLRITQNREQVIINARGIPVTVSNLSDK